MSTTIICLTICLLAVAFTDVFVNAAFFLVKSIAFMIQSAAWVISLVILVGSTVYVAGLLLA